MTSETELCKRLEHNNDEIPNQSDKSHGYHINLTVLSSRTPLDAFLIKEITDPGSDLLQHTF